MSRQSHPKANGSDSNVLPFVTKVSENDILMGRGAKIDKNEGNKSFRELVRQHKKEYMSTSRQQRKHEITMKIMNEITSRGGFFLRIIKIQDNNHSLKAPEGLPAWCYVADDVAIKKVKQALRGDEKRNQNIHPEDLPISKNDTVRDISQRYSDISCTGNNSLYERLQTCRSTEPFASSRYRPHSLMPIDTMEFSRLIKYDRTSNNELESEADIASSNQSIQISLEMQRFQNQLLFSKRMPEYQMNYQLEASISNPENSLLSQIEELQRNRYIHLSNVHHGCLHNTQSFSTSAGAPIYPSSYDPRLTIQKGTLQALNSTLGDQRIPFISKSLIHNQFQEVLLRTDIESRAQNMIQEVLARSDLKRQHSIGSNIILAYELLNSTNIRNNEQIYTMQDM